jgi:hypothetical protein
MLAHCLEHSVDALNKSLVPISAGSRVGFGKRRCYQSHKRHHSADPQHYAIREKFNIPLEIET